MLAQLLKIALCLCLGLGIALPLALFASNISSSSSGLDLSSSAEAIAAEIAMDSGKPASAYRDYAARLAETLAQMTPEARDRVLGEAAYRIGMGNDEGGQGPQTPSIDPESNPGSDPTSNPASDPTSNPTSDPGTDPAGGSNSNPASADDQGLLDMLAAQLGSSQLRDSLVNASPLSSQVLTAAIQNRTPQLGSSHLREVLLANVPLPSDVYALVAGNSTNLDSSDLSKVLKAHQAAQGSATTTP